MAPLHGCSQCYNYQRFLSAKYIRVTGKGSDLVYSEGREAIYLLTAEQIFVLLLQRENPQNFPALRWSCGESSLDVHGLRNALCFYPKQKWGGRQQSRQNTTVSKITVNKRNCSGKLTFLCHLNMKSPRRWSSLQHTMQRLLLQMMSSLRKKLIIFPVTYKITFITQPHLRSQLFCLQHVTCYCHIVKSENSV